VVTTAATQIVSQVAINLIKGNGLVVKNLKTYLSTEAEGIAQGYVTQLTDGTVNLCNFNNAFLGNLTLHIKRYTAPNFSDSLASAGDCTLSQVVKNADPTLFSTGAGDFTNGGWGAFYVTTTQLAQNPFGAATMAKEASKEEAEDKKDKSKQELSWGNGVLSLKDGSGVTIEPAKFINDQLHSKVSVPLKKLGVSDEVTDAVVAVIGVALQQAQDQLMAQF